MRRLCDNLPGFGRRNPLRPDVVLRAQAQPAAHMLLIKRPALTPLTLYNEPPQKKNTTFFWVIIAQSKC